MIENKLRCVSDLGIVQLKQKTARPKVLSFLWTVTLKQCMIHQWNIRN